MRCVVCNHATDNWIYKEIISDDLARRWRLGASQIRKFNLRESQFCPICKNNFRARSLAEGIMKVFPFEGVNCLQDWTKEAKNAHLKLAEINACGNLHKTLKKLSGLKYSEYYPKLSEGTILLKLRRLLWRLRHNTIHQDITHLAYSDNIFDLILHSETLEHIPDVDKAMKECYRVLKPSGWCLFTVPIIPTRKSIVCAKYEKGMNIKYLKSPSYHGTSNMSDYLVWHEFGGDLIQRYNLKIIITHTNSMTWVLGFRKPRE